MKMVKRVLYILEILICIVMAVLAAWHWKMFYRKDFAARDVFIHVPALLAYGILILLLVKGLLAEYEPLSVKVTKMAYFKLLCTMVVLAIVFMAAVIFNGLSEAAPVYLREFTDAELKAYNLRETVKSFGGAAACFWPFMAVGIWLSDVFTNDYIQEKKDDQTVNL